VIRKAVITAAGAGTRLLPATKELAKEMLPLLSQTKDGNPILKPMLQTVYESLYDFGIKNFCFVVGRNRRSVEDHFSINLDLKNKIFQQNIVLRKDMKIFYERLRKSFLLYLEQTNPKGFGDAVLRSKDFVGDDNFLLHTGDDLVYSKLNHFKRLNNCLEKFHADVGLLIQKVQDPRKYGVVEIKQTHDNYFSVLGIEEKPKKPKSKFAIIGIYSFRPIILDYLKFQKPDKKNEIQLTDAIQNLLKDGHKIVASKLRNSESRIDIGTPENYARSIFTSFKKIN